LGHSSDQGIYLYSFLQVTVCIPSSPPFRGASLWGIFLSFFSLGNIPFFPPPKGLRRSFGTRETLVFPFVPRSRFFPAEMESFFFAHPSLEFSFFFPPPPFFVSFPSPKDHFCLRGLCKFSFPFFFFSIFSLEVGFTLTFWHFSVPPPIAPGLFFSKSTVCSGGRIAFFLGALFLPWNHETFSSQVRAVDFFFFPLGQLFEGEVPPCCQPVFLFFFRKQSPFFSVMDDPFFPFFFFPCRPLFRKALFSSLLPTGVYLFRVSPMHLGFSFFLLYRAFPTGFYRWFFHRNRRSFPAQPNKLRDTSNFWRMVPPFFLLRTKASISGLVFPTFFTTRFSFFFLKGINPAFSQKELLSFRPYFSFLAGSPRGRQPFGVGTAFSPLFYFFFVKFLVLPFLAVDESFLYGRRFSLLFQLLGGRFFSAPLSWRGYGLFPSVKTLSHRSRTG